MKTSTALDITKAERDLQRTIVARERQYTQLITNTQRIKHELSKFEHVYNRKILRLRERLDELEQLLFKYRNISEHVDELFSFAEAQKIFDETMEDRKSRMEDEFRRKKKVALFFDKKRNMSAKEREEIKRFYRNLAHMFHPDKTGGDEQMMKLINKAYREGNLKALRDLNLEHVPPQEGNTFSRLKHRLRAIYRSITKAQKELSSLQRSDLYILKTNLLKPNPAQTGTNMDSLAKELRKDIVRKEAEVEQFKEKFSPATEDSGFG